MAEELTPRTAIANHELGGPVAAGDRVSCTACGGGHPAESFGGATNANLLQAIHCDLSGEDFIVGVRGRLAWGHTVVRDG